MNKLEFKSEKDRRDKAGRMAGTGSEEINRIEGLDILEHTGNGFQTMIRFESWRIALAVRGTDQEEAPIRELSRHLETDEVFVLLKGGCTIFTGGQGEEPSDIMATGMEPFRLYNIRKGTWHARTLLPGSEILVVENDGTGPQNSESKALPEGMALS